MIQSTAANDDKPEPNSFLLVRVVMASVVFITYLWQGKNNSGSLHDKPQCRYTWCCTFNDFQQSRRQNELLDFQITSLIFNRYKHKLRLSKRQRLFCQHDPKPKLLFAQSSLLVFTFALPGKVHFFIVS